MSRFFFSLPSNEQALRASDGIFRAVIEPMDLDRNEKHRLLVIVSELFSNAYLHGNKADPGRFIEITLELSDGVFQATARDQGTGIMAEKLRESIHSGPDPDSDHGRGLKIMHKLGDTVDMGTDANGGFCVRVARKVKPAVAPAVLTQMGKQEER